MTPGRWSRYSSRMTPIIGWRKLRPGRSTVPRFTVWPVITEAAYFLRHDSRAIGLLLREIERGNLTVMEVRPEDTPRISELISKYSDLPMDYTDAALVVCCERLAITTVFTFDRNFSIYRPSHAARFETIP